MADTVIENMSSVIEVDLTRGVPDSLPALDSLWKKFYTTWMGVIRDGIGASWKKIWTFSENNSGVFKWVTPLGPAATAADTSVTNDGYAHSSQPGLRSYPSMDDSVWPAWLQKEVQLAMGVGNLFLPHEYRRATKLDACIVDAVELIIKGTAKNVALAEIGAFYAHDSSRSLAIVANTPTLSGNSCTFPVKGGSIRQLQNGMHVDIYDYTDSFATKLNGTARVVVDGVRYVVDTTNDTGGYGMVTLRHNQSGSDWSAVFGTAVATNDIIVLADSWDSTNTRSYGPVGPESWLLASGATPFGINVTTYQQFVSVVNDVDGSLTETLLNRMWGRYFKAYGLADIPDTIVTSTGVTTNYVENRSLSAPGFVVNRDQGDRFMLGEGYEIGSAPFAFHGQRVGWYDTPFMPSLSDATDSTVNGGRLWGLKTRDKNLNRLVPPPIGSSKTLEGFGREIEFTYPIGGPMGICKPYHDTNGRSTNIMEAPFEVMKAIVPKTIPGIKMTSLSETL